MPDLAWALVFVVAVGLGPFAGMLAIMVDTLGFCARFFADDMENVDPGPAEALTATGARKIDIAATAIVPAAMPAFISTSLFGLEKAVRSSTILGLVGAGGIGIELKVGFDLFDYQTAMTVILMIAETIYATDAKLGGALILRFAVPWVIVDSIGSIIAGAWFNAAINLVVFSAIVAPVLLRRGD